MYIKEIAVRNYKCFDEPSRITFGPGINVLVGQNSSGKSSLLEALGLTFSHNPHRSIRTRPDPDIPLNTPSSVDVTFSVAAAELWIYLRRSGQQQVIIPFPPLDDALIKQIGVVDNSPSEIQKFVDWFCNHERFNFRLRRLVVPGGNLSWANAGFPSFDFYDLKPGSNIAALCSIRGNGSLQFVQLTAAQPNGVDIGTQLAEVFRSDVYRFAAERFGIGRSKAGMQKTLVDSARNLPEVINNLNATPGRLEEFNAAVREVLPNIRRVTTKVVGTDEVEIAVWNIDPGTGRDDLAVRLEECGTGTGQVLAILYTAFILQRSSVVLIDEPQTFLHPGAARKLIEALRIQGKHQYILTTHSPSIISAGNPATITLCRSAGVESNLEQLNASGNAAQELCLAEVGARLSDVFGSDNILWVEGRTEELCYRKIFHRFGQKDLAGTSILGVRNTGDLEGDLAERMLEIYNKISTSNSLIPPALGFIFDSECRSPQKQKELIAKSKGLLHFLARRMYENYLLSPAAIAKVANGIKGFRAVEISVEEISPVLEEALNNPEYYCDKKVPAARKDQTAWVHGKKVLKDLFSNLSEKRVEYREVEHGCALTDWLIENAPQELEEVATLVRTVLGQKAA